MLKRTCLCSATLALFAGLTTNIQAVEQTPLIDIAQSTQTIDANNFQTELTLHGFEIDGKSNHTISLSFNRVAGSDNKLSASGYNRSGHKIDASGLVVSDGHLRGTLLLTIMPDNWLPKDKQAIPFTLEIDAEIKPTGEGQDLNATAGGHWGGSVGAQAQRWDLSGSWKTDTASGELEGNGSLALKPEHFDMGVLNKEGLHLQMNLGNKRVSWNKAAVLAQLPFSEARDLSTFSGITVELKPDTPRNDATVTLWLEEADGGWYYHTGSIPLSAETIRYTALFSDFSEAEWISPTNHMDDNFSLDLDQIKTFGIGVVNPFGIGELGMTVTKLELQPLLPMNKEPAQVTVSGNLLALNGHDVIPGGMFGGFYPDLDLKYRPGSMRHMFTLPSGNTADPVRRSYSFTDDDIKDPQALAKLLLKPESPIQEQISANIDKRTAGRLPKHLKQYKEDDWRSVRRLKSTVASALNRAVGMQQLQEDKLPSKGPEREELFYKNRMLLGEIYAGLIAHELAVKPAPGLFSIDCQGDRTQVATFLKHDDWAERLREAGTSYGENAVANGFRNHVEFWNEPYLNWEIDRLNFNLKHFREDLAVEGGPVTVKRKEQADEVIIPHFVWRKKDDGSWKIEDETAFTFWTGKGNGWIYDTMLLEYAKAVKAVDERIPVIGGWGFRWNEDHWASWDLLHKPTIDRAIDYIDGVEEHHYQGDPRAILASYEVLTAYGVTAHNKWLYGYNTETNDLVDAPARGAIETPEQARNNRLYRVGSYNFRDIIYALAQIPDKARARTIIHADTFQREVEMVYGNLADLRGRLAEAHSDDPGVFVVSSVDGSDPQFPRPQGGYALVTALFNDHRKERTVTINLQAPAGTTFSGEGEIRTPWLSETGEALGANKELIAASGSSLQRTVTIPARSAWIASLPLDGPPDQAQTINRQQFFSPVILQHIGVNKPVSFPIDLSKQPASSSAARLRLVVENVDENEAVLMINGHELVLPRTITPDNGPRIIELPIDVTWLQEATEIVCSVGPGSHAGYRVNMASIVTNHSAE